MPAMTSSLFAVTIDCADAAALARFWADVLGWQVAEDSNSGQAVLLAGDGDPSAPRIVFNKVPRAEDRQEPPPPRPRQRHLRRRDRAPAAPGRPKAPRPADRRGPLDDLRRHRGQRVRPDRQVALQASSLCVWTAKRRTAQASLDGKPGRLTSSPPRPADPPVLRSDLPSAAPARAADEVEQCLVNLVGVGPDDRVRP